jgi:uncharacterized protein with von Willebrand factor type A (vWA) domain
VSDDDQVLAILPAFCRELRNRGGIRISTSQLIVFQSAVAVLPRLDLEDLYWCGRTTLGVEPNERALYDGVFAEFFVGASVPPPPPNSDTDDELSGHDGPASSEQSLARPAPVMGDTDRDDSPDDAELAGADASTVELLRITPFAACSADEQATLRSLIRRLRVRPPLRRVRRFEPSRHGMRLDLRRTARSTLRHQGDVFPLWRNHQVRPRRIVMLLDVSRSMAPYSRLLLHFAHAMSVSGLEVEVVCFGTRVTRVTRLIRKHKSAQALETAAEAVLDWDGGTRIGEAVREAQTIGTIRGALRDSVVLMLSDGLEQDDPAPLAFALARMRRTCHSLVWANPLAGDPNYQPLTAGMLAAMPYIDILCPGDTLDALERLVASLSELQMHERQPRRSIVRAGLAPADAPDAQRGHRR